MIFHRNLLGLEVLRFTAVPRTGSGFRLYFNKSNCQHYFGLKYLCVVYDNPHDVPLHTDLQRLLMQLCAFVLQSMDASQSFDATF